MNVTNSVSAIAVVDLANELINQGLLSETELKAIGYDLYDAFVQFALEQSIVERRLPEVYLVTLWQRVGLESKLSFDMSRKVNDYSKGLLANWISYSDTLATAFNIFNENISLLNQAEQWELHAAPTDKITLSFCHQSCLNYPSNATERSMVAVVVWASELLGEKLIVDSAQFAYPQPTYHDEYTSLFGQKISFGAKSNHIVIFKDQFHKKLLHRNPYLQSILKERAKHVQEFMVGRSTTVAKVKTLLAMNFRKYCNVDDLVSALNVSRATLYRRLKEEGWTHSNIVREARLSKIPELKGQNISCEDMAFQLGFRDVSSYYRLLKSQENDPRG